MPHAHAGHGGRNMQDEEVYATEVQDRDNLVTCTEVAAADTVPRKLASIRGSIRRRCEACVQVEG
jgi:hypothetical protein